MARLNYFFLKFIFISPCVICVISICFMNFVVPANNTRICIQNPSREEISTPDAASFERFLSSTKLYIDKTELITYLAGASKLSQKVEVTTFPRRFGKTLNMVMIEFFFKIEVYPNNTIVPQRMSKSYQFFTTGKFKDEDGNEVAFEPKPLLSEPKYENIVQTHCAKYPVIRVEFKAFTIFPTTTTFDKFLDNFGQRIQRMFESHMYLKEHLIMKVDKATSDYRRKSAEADLEFFSNAIQNKLEYDGLKNSIVKLSEMLKERFSNMQVIILIDEYDQIINQIFFQDHRFPSELRNTILEFYIKFLTSTLHVNADNYIQAILIGIMNIRNAGIPDLNYLTHNHMFSPKINRFYGISKSEADALFNIYEIEKQERDEIEKYYDGYKYPTGNGQFGQFYNTFNIVNYLNNAKCKMKPMGYWTGTGHLDANFRSMMMMSHIKTKLEPLFSKDGLFVTMWNNFKYQSLDANILIFTLEEIESLGQVSHMQSDFTKDTQDNADIFFKLLLATGYLAGDGTYSLPPRFVFPNEEVFRHLLNVYREEYQKNFGETFITLARKFGEFLFDDNLQSKELENAFVEFNTANKHQLIPHISKSDQKKDHSAIIPPGTVSAIEVNEAYFASVLRTVSIYIRSEKPFVSFEYLTKEGMIDLYFHNYQDKRAAIVELKYAGSHQKIQKAFSQLAKYHTEHNYKYKVITILGQTDGSIEVGATFHRPNCTDKNQKITLKNDHTFVGQGTQHDRRSNPAGFI